MENQQAKEISLEVIALNSTNEMFRPKSDLTEDALKDLADSIKQFGVIQPIVVRPSRKNEFFILICGERRYRASQLAGKKTIPAMIRDVSEEVALVMQITENMQREDVHPLNEAKGFKMILENDKNMTTAELALKFGKSETYILQRLKLNDLVREARKAFFEERLLLGHAMILARLTPADQRDALEQIAAYNGNYGTVADLQEFVDRQIMANLSKAPFDLKDEALYKKAGSCTACPKRSGASPLLFADIKEKDRCFDKGCFFTKCEKFLVNRTRQAIETEPNLVFLTNNYDHPSEKIAAMLNDHKLKPIIEYNDFSEHNQGGSKVKGLWISGRKAGQVATVYLKKEVKEASGNNNVKVVAAKIQERMVRGRELDGEKVYAKILEGLKAHPTQKKTHEQKMLKEEEVFLWYVIYNKARFSTREILNKALELNLNKSEKFYEALKNLAPEQRAFMLRKVMLDQYGGNYPATDYGFIIRKIAEAYGDIDIKGFEKEQAEIRTKREQRAQERVKHLQKKGKEVKSKS
ncbi:MAG TPA: ParB/RepB/Spo0J family partition protein [Cyclobacteriaceae bacterium]|nr:ParB/RepB/Spo0J family partition protein [Cyclobacteriaceae bacterium]HRF35296.1 ParB/RepB/Spo0J family partition protein [Cyclobacteriaceae bacterium]